MDTLSRLTAAALALLLSVPAWAVDAQTNASPFRPTVTYPSGVGGQAVVTPARIQGPVSAADFGRVWGPALGSLGDVNVTDTVPDAKVAGIPVEVKSTRKIPWKGIATAAGAFAGSAGAVVAGAVALKDLYDAYHCDLGLGKCDQGTAPQEETVTCYIPGGSSTCYEPSALVTLVRQNIANVYKGSSEQPCNFREEVTDHGGSIAVAVYFQTRISGGECAGPERVQGASGIKTTDVQEVCQAAIDPLNPAYSYPRGHAPTPDGKCRTGRYSTPNPGGLASRFEQAPDGYKERAPEIAKDIADAGKDLTPQAGPQSLTGPGTVPGKPTSTTTTGPNGQPQTTTTNTTHNVSYTNNSYSWTSVVITNNHDGTTIVDERPPDDIPPSDCEVNPNAIGCKELGPIPEVAEIPKLEVPVAIAPDSGWGAETGSCPSPKQLSFLGQPMEMSWQPICDFATGTRWIVIALASMAAAWILMGANQKGDD